MFLRRFTGCEGGARVLLHVCVMFMSCLCLQPVPQQRPCSHKGDWLWLGRGLLACEGKDGERCSWMGPLGESCLWEVTVAGGWQSSSRAGRPLRDPLERQAAAAWDGASRPPGQSLDLVAAGMRFPRQARLRHRERAMPLARLRASLKPPFVHAELLPPCPARPPPPDAGTLSSLVRRGGAGLGPAGQLGWG